jgi:hypothetical protein
MVFGSLKMSSVSSSPSYFSMLRITAAGTPFLVTATASSTLSNRRIISKSSGLRHFLFWLRKRSGTIGTTGTLERLEPTVRFERSEAVERLERLELAFSFYESDLFTSTSGTA